MHAWRRWTLMLLAATTASLLIAGCSGSGNSLFSIDQATETEIGQQAALDIEAEYGLANNPAQTARIEVIGNAIAAATERPELPWSFRILESAEVNAMSLPGGPVYVTSGLLAVGLTDSELAGVLAHEAAHVNERHSVKRIQDAMTMQLLQQLVFGGSAEAVQQAADLAVQVASELPGSRADEYQADDVGIRLAYNAGYPAHGLVDFLEILLALGESDTPAFLRTHPATEDRIAAAEVVVTAVNGSPRPVAL